MAASFELVLLWLQAVGVLLTAGYLIATRKRNRRAAVVGLCGVGLLGLIVVDRVVLWYSEVRLYEHAFRAIGVSDRRVPTVSWWTHCVLTSVAYGLLLWAVVADRPPAEPDDE